MSLSESMTRAALHRERITSPKQGFRRDIQGLRAIAVGAVVLYHLWPKALHGGFVGVDVFFVISGFLITGHLLDRVPTGPRDLLQFWGRRVRRLLPASLIVLAAVTVAVWFLAPSSTWMITARQIIASTFYVQNWELAQTSVDYLAADNAASPVQHFWSLSVEEQFYVIWPVLIGIAAWIASRRSRQTRAITIAVALVAVLSFGYGVWLTANDPGSAYFVTPTRMWELAVGGLVAIALRARWSRTVQRMGILAWAGVALLLFSIFWIDGTMPFPGVVALLPVMGTALVLLAGNAAGTTPAPVLGSRPMRFIGDSSYAIYLWHWPLIVLAPAVTGSIGVLDKAAIVCVSLVLGWISTRYLEPPFRSKPFWQPLGRTFGFALAAMLVVTAGATALALRSTATVSASADRVAQAELTDTCFGAAALPAAYGGSGACDITGNLLQEPAAAKTDKSDAYADKCWSSGDFASRPICTYGEGDTRVALVGNSHAGHWLPALQTLAKQRGWTITTFLIDRCNATVDIPLAFDSAPKTQGCQDYAKYVAKATTDGSFDAIIVSERQSVPAAGHTWATTEDSLRASQERFLTSWTEAKIPIFVIRDTPFPGGVQVDGQPLNIPDCVASAGGDLRSCDGTPETWKWMDPLASAATEVPGNVAVLDPEAWICPDGVCRAVIGGVITYFDGSHLTATYARSLAPYLNDWLDKHPELGL